MTVEAIQGYRLSPQQRHLWLSSQESGTKRAHCLIRLEGEIDVPILKRSVRRLIERHEILRTDFHHRPGVKVPVQAIIPDRSAEWTQLDLRRLDVERREASVSEIFAAEGRRPLALGEETRLKCSFFRLAARDFALLLSLPSLCADGFTLRSIFAEIARGFPGESPGEDASLHGLDYLQVSEWQHSLHEEDEASAARDYWDQEDKKLKGFSPVRLPIEGYPAGPYAQASRPVSTVIDPDVATRIERWTSREESSHASFLLACWQVLLWRLTGRRGVSVGVVFDGRRFEELREVLGPLSRVLPVGVELHGGMTLRNVVKRVQASVLSKARWQYYATRPESKEVDGAESAPTVSFEFDGRDRERRVGTGVTLTLDREHSGDDAVTLRLSCGVKSDALVVNLYAAPSSFRVDDLRRLCSYFENLLSHGARDPQAAIGELELLGRRQRRQILEELNDMPERCDTPQCVHRLFERQVEQGPDRTAVVFTQNQLSFAELNSRANRLAHHLRSLDNGTGSLVGLALDRSVDAIVAILAILKSGAAYVPLDLTQPKRRLEMMLGRGSLKVLISLERTLGHLPATGATVVCLDRDDSEIVRRSTSDPSWTVEPEALAYVIFTSGSTGVPKGVAVEHRQLFNYVSGIQSRLALSDLARFAIVSTFAADLGNTTLFGSLSSGGCLHVLPENEATDPDAWAEFLERCPIDFMKIVPSHLKVLVEIAGAQRALPVRRLVLGGEACERTWVEGLRRSSSCAILNHYGPTETTVGVMTYEVDESLEGLRLPTVPIGEPLPNSKIYLLDRCLEPVAPWCPGDVYIAGSGLARGYIGRPGATAEKFLPNPYALESGSRMYQSGDLGRQLPGIGVEFLGRGDDQVKLRGFRIELGEIEQALRCHPHVENAVARLRQDDAEEKHLAAFVVPLLGESPSVKELRAWSVDRLPSHMVPALFILVSSLPLTPNGKVDRSALDREALPKPEETSPEERAKILPRTPFEEVLAAMWCEILGIVEVGIDESFFELGGHSLLATRLVVRLRETFEVDLPVRVLFDSPTIEGLARAVENALRSEATVGMPPLAPVSREQPLPLSFAQQRLWFLDQLAKSETASYNAATAVRLEGALNIASLRAALSEVVRRHEVLRTTFCTVKDRPVQVIYTSPEAAGDLVPLRLVDLKTLPAADRDKEARSLAREESRRPFDLARGPLVRCRLLAVADRDHVMLLTLHHIVSDAWSMAVLVRELVTLYEAFSASRPSPLPELDLQYADYAYWQREWLAGAVLEKELRYWKSRLSRLPPPLDLPTDHPRPAVRSYRGGYLPFTLGPVLSEKLRHLSRQEESTLFMTLLAAYSLLLFRYSQQDDIVVGADVANRNRAGLEGLIGFFINMLVLRVDLSGDPSFRTLLRRTRKVALEAFAHQEVPYDKLVEELRPSRTSGERSLFRAVLNFNNAPTPVPAIKGLESSGINVKAFELETESVRFDLVLTLREEGGGELSGFWSFSTDLFKPSTIARMRGHFETLLMDVVAQPDKKLRDLEFLTQEEKARKAKEVETKKRSNRDKLLRGKRRQVQI